MRLQSVLAVRKGEVESLEKALELRKSKYAKRWKGKDGKWHYKYGKELVRKKPTEAEVQRNIEQGRGNKKPSEIETAKNLREGKTKNIKSSKADIVKNLKEGKSGSKRKLANKMTTKLKDNIEKKNKESKAYGTEALPQDISTLSIDNVTSLIKQSVKMTLKRIKENQDIVDRQKGIAYKQKNVKAYKRLEVMENIYQAAVDIKEFKFTTASAWAKEIIGKIK